MFIREDVDFLSHGVRCSAWFYRPKREEKYPVIVMAHGLGGVREMRLDAYAERFVQAGFACFLFDYRNFGASDGRERQKISVKEQLGDWHHAIDFVKQDGQVNQEEILLFGTSFSGGHVIVLSSQRTDIRASIAQCPYTDTLATLRTVPLLTGLKTIPVAIADKLGAVLGCRPLMLKLAGAPNSAAIMAVPDYGECFRLIPANYDFINQAPARTLLEFLTYSPSRYTQNVQCPIFYAVCLKDSLAPAKETIACAKRSVHGVIGEYDMGHFEIYLGQAFEQVIRDYIDFYGQVLAD
ncbi:alpha/beta hydrolase [Neisseria leonii]|uniref:alpha/beta hydrolase n=1 Tax=Neisseria leonii TaxID=2995413 RepID=UPI00237B1106|nr:alpha/beta fold hydrolase [Neisseria sp. 3986]MDD9324950.1 alpha/beta hydrolase [Neisseria sp. 3986]